VTAGGAAAEGGAASLFLERSLSTTDTFIHSSLQTNIISTVSMQSCNDTTEQHTDTNRQTDRQTQWTDDIRTACRPDGCGTQGTDICPHPPCTIDAKNVQKIFL